MDRRLFLLAAAGAMLPGCASIGGDSGPPASAPVYRVGDRWTYSGKDGYRQPVTWVETHEVVAVDAQGIAIRVTQKGPSVDTTRIERLSAPGIVTEGALFDSETRRFKTPLTRYRFPLTPGTHWNQFIDNFDESTQQDGQINNYMSVRRWEKVKVPAGEFDAIVLRDFSRLDDETFWRYATALNYEIWWSPAHPFKAFKNSEATRRSSAPRHLPPVRMRRRRPQDVRHLTPAVDVRAARACLECSLCIATTSAGLPSASTGLWPC